MKKILTIIFSIIGIIIFVTGGFLGVAVISGKPIKVETNKVVKGLHPTLTNAIYLASVSPTPLNTQMWKIVFDNSTDYFTIRLDSTRTLSFDEDLRQAYLSLGCFIESLNYALLYSGYNSIIEIYKTPTENLDVAKFSITQYEDYSDENTLKKFDSFAIDFKNYKKNKIEPDTLNKILLTNINLTYFEKNSIEFEYLKQGSIAARTLQANDENFRKEVASLTRFSNKTVKEKKDGISADYLGLKSIKKSFFNWFNNKAKIEKQNYSRKFVNSYVEKIDNSAGFFVLSGFESFEGLIMCGRQLQSLFFTCMNEGISLEPIQSMIEVSNFYDNIKKDLNLIYQPYIILRAGYSIKPAHASYIVRDLQDFILVN